MRINVIFHDIVKDGEKLTNKYSVNKKYFINFLNYIAPLLDNITPRPELHLYFDDGYVSFHEIIMPLLKTIPFPITIAVILDKLNTQGYLADEQVVSIAKTKITIASHGVSHAALAVYKENLLQDTPSNGKYENSPFGQGEPLSENEIKYQFAESKEKL